MRIRRAGGRAPQAPALGRYSSLLPAGPGRRIVLVADPNAGDALTDLLDWFREDRVVVVAEEAVPEWRLRRRGAEFRVAGPKAVSDRLRPFGRIDVVVNLRSDTDAAHLRMWRALFFHVREGGAYVVDRRRILPNKRRRGPSLLRKLARLAPVVGAPRKRIARQVGQRDVALARALGAVTIGADHVVLTKRDHHLLKVPDVGATRLLAQRSDGALRVSPLQTVPGGTLPGASVTSYGERTPPTGFDPVLRYPQLHLRRYDGRVCVGPGGVLHDEWSVFPDAFRWHLRSDRPQARLDHANDDFAMLREQNLPSRVLEGRYYYLDYSNAGHFGHLMTEAMAKFWGWPVAKAKDPDLKVLLRVPERYPERPEPRLETRMLEAYGVALDDLVWIDEPVWVDSLVAATPMWHNAPPFHAHPGIREVWERIADNLADDSAPRHERIFVTRPPAGNRACRNVAEVEEVFARHGFEIVSPQHLDLAVQAGMFSTARIIAGLAGSGLFNMMYTRTLSTVIVLSQEAYTARNEYLYASLLGADIHYFWNPPDVDHPEGSESYQAHQSSWQFDFERNGAELERLLAALP